MLEEIIASHPEFYCMKQLTDHLDAISKKSKTTKLWVDCLIKPNFLMCSFLRAAREQDLFLHHAAAKAMLPYFPPSGGHNYARYGTLYVHHLETLPDSLVKKLMHDCSLRINDGILMPYTLTSS